MKVNILRGVLAYTVNGWYTGQVVQEQSLPLMSDVLLAKDKRGMISRVYSISLHSTHDASKLPCRKRWEKDLGAINSDKWELCLSSTPLVSILASQKRPVFKPAA